MLRGAFLAASLFCVASNAQADLGRDDQWTFIPANAEHGARAELRGDHPEGVPSLLIFQIECSAGRTLTFRYDLTPDLGELDMGELAQPMASSRVTGEVSALFLWQPDEWTMNWKACSL